MKKYFGDKNFYKMVLVVAIPLLIQQLITSFVNMLDNIMVGQTGTLAMSGVSVSNQIITVFNLAIFGSVSAASIFGAQFAGKKDADGVRHCLRFKLIVEVVIALLFIIVFTFFGDKLIGLFMHADQDDATDIAKTMEYALSYMHWMTIGFIPFALSQSISSSMRESGETRLPMIASVTAVVVNFIGNCILIFGLLGFPALGPSGAAIATVISRFAELLVIIVFALLNKERFPFYIGLFKGFSIPLSLVKEISIKGLPLVVNELLWSIGTAMITQCYSTRGIDALAAYNISSTITNLFFVSNIAMGDSISILVGHHLGAGRIEEAVDTDRKLIVFTVMIAICFGLTLVILAPLFPNLYQTTDSVKGVATMMLRFGGLTMWISAIYNASYFTLRCGGKTIITFLFDSVGTICVSFTVAYLLAHFTQLPVQYMYLTVVLVDLYKVVLGLFLVNKRIWVNNLVGE
jgi:putative MATE family efflux protein